ncbi:MAG: DNA polymerase III subunit delta' [Oscillospiraceae bacterium]|jgi:DNA polymerase III delta' subunit|nr:DNA polymerase III subunit delta' [Oscillospiraceae bacterium]
MDFVFPTANARRVYDSYKRRAGTHAILITGEAGVGKRSLAFLLAKTVLCGADDNPCGTCGSCVRVESRTHPDAHCVRPGDNKSRTISVEQIRALIEQISIRSFEGGAKAVIIENADGMQPAAQNALLKSLEEPPGDVFFFLTASRRLDLLPTIRSRCAWLHLPPLDIERTADILKSQGFDAKLANEAALYAEGSVGQAADYAKTSAEYVRAVESALASVGHAIDIPFAAKKILDLSQKKSGADGGYSALDIIERYISRLNGFDSEGRIRIYGAIEDSRKRDALFLPKQQTMEDLLAVIMEER